MSTPPQNLDAERSVLGAMLVTERVIDPVLAECGLQAEHFYRDTHRDIYRTICELHEKAQPVDVISVPEAGGHDKDYVASLAAKVPAPGSAVHYAKVVIENADMRLVDMTGKQMVQSVAERDGSAAELLGTARAALDKATPSGDPYLSPAALREFAFKVAEGERGGRTFPWPFEKLNALSGGLRTGQLILIAGWTHHGKSAFAGQVLDSVASSKASACLYFNEMDAEEHIGGWLQRRYAVPSLPFVQGKLDAGQRKKFLEALNDGLPFGMTPIAGWDARAIAAHIRLHRWDVAVVDILHNIHYEDERDLSNAITAFTEAAKLAECAVVLVAHLNRGRLQSAERPLPSLRDLRGTGDLENKADIVCFVHREQDPSDYTPTAESKIFLAKCRGGRLGGLDAEFDQRRIRFLPIDTHVEEPAQLEKVG